MRLIFARHGESQANVERIISNRDLYHPLTETGRDQAAALAGQLANDRLVAIYASPLLRAQETAQIIAERLNLTAITVDALREFDCGVVEGRGDPDAWRAHNDVIAAWNHDQAYDRRIEGGESFNDMRARFVPFVESVVDQYGGASRDLLCVGHGSLFTQMLPLVLPNIDRTFIDVRGLGNCVPVVAELYGVQLACITWGDHPASGQS